jgi:hypothetical protein
VASKKEFTKPDISQNVHLGFSSNLKKINFNICTTGSISKTRGILLRFKIAANFKMAVKNWFLTITQSISNIFTFSLLLFVSHHITQISNREKFFIRYIMASEIKNGG